MIKHGTRVVIETTNGGRTEGELYHDYVPSYAVYFHRDNSDDCTVIPGWRVESVRPVEVAP